MPTHKEHLQELIAEGNIKQAIKELLEATKSNGQKDLHNAIILQSAPFNRNETAKREGTISQENYELAWNKVRSALLHYLEEYEEVAGYVYSLTVKTTEMKEVSTLNNQISNSNMKDVFISYSTKDQAAKNELVAFFEKEGITYWLDEIDINTIGANLEQTIEEGIKNTKCTVFIVSENSLLSLWVSKESLFRLMEENFTKENVLLPLLVDKKAFDSEFVFDVYDNLKAILDKEEINRQRAKDRNMNTSLYDVKINRLQRILPQITDIFQKITEGLSANVVDEKQKEAYWNKLLQTIKSKKSKSLDNQANKTIIQNAGKIYNIDKIDNANFS